jgi:hypothetical protein
VEAVAVELTQVLQAVHAQVVLLVISVGLRVALAL